MNLPSLYAYLAVGFRMFLFNRFYFTQFKWGCVMYPVWLVISLLLWPIEMLWILAAWMYYMIKEFNQR